MCIYDPGNIPDSVPDEVSNHGLFVAGLVHGAAPDVHLHLVRVLDDQAHGTQAWLTSGLLGLINANNFVSGTTVVNLSLGLAPRVGDWTLDEIGILNTSHLQFVADSILPTIGAPSVPIPIGPFMPLALALRALRRQGVTIVASSGNEGAGSPLVPALYEDTIAAQGINVGGTGACFSNTAGGKAPAVWAPSGDGQQGCAVPDLTPCWNVPFSGPAPSCPDVLKQLVVISLVLDDETSTSYSQALPNLPRGFAAWEGTSFSSALVSGWAALQLSPGKNGTPRSPGTGWLGGGPGGGLIREGP
jgi:subtilisin family serine protease